MADPTSDPATPDRPSGYVITVEAHRKRMDAQRDKYERELSAVRTNLGVLKDKFRDLVSIRLTKPGSPEEQQAWDDLMEVVGDV